MSCSSPSSSTWKQRRPSKTRQSPYWREDGHGDNDKNMRPRRQHTPRNNFTDVRWQCNNVVHNTILRENNKNLINKRTSMEVEPNRRDSLLMRNCLAQSVADRSRTDDEQQLHLKGVDTGMHIVILGTGSSMPTTSRNSSCTAINLGGRKLLFDVSEGVQRQLHFSTFNVRDVSDIFITHMHADHIMGLPSLLLCMDQAFKSKKINCKNNEYSESSSQVHEEEEIMKPVNIYGPEGLHNFVVMNLSMCCATFQMPLNIYELTGGNRANNLPSLPPGRSYLGMSNPFTASYPEFNLFPSVRHHKIPMNTSDETWTLSEGIEVSEELVKSTFLEDDGNARRKAKIGERKLLPNNYHSGEHKALTIRAAEVKHKKHVQTFGYVVEEMDPPRLIDREKAISCGVYPGKKYAVLKNGFAVCSDDDPTVMVQPEDVLVPKELSRRGRRFALLGDNCGAYPSMEKLCRNVDVLVHEAITTSSASPQSHKKSMPNMRWNNRQHDGYSNEERDAIKKGHSTASMAGRFASRVKAQLLILNHISAAGNEGDETREAVRAANGGVGYVVTAHDFMEVLVPRGGFDFLPLTDEGKPQ